ncbi:uncharacterized protein M421DRAFT_54615 [Didymella exigua CBS 183.55]|uniref:SMP domain-containing protein n=1 Tax=Didymella exigua CBS 183.55 TaxID=1150837 RepID=A0A6A5RWY1_9PLEO|nr:uncharacterized protein M421DRAFT_54615 [Didymella exigua CBS 183.55]KAF1932083.1 hypothetical protein M421DRAFT_54615 [Didymella exigua CBS 183.55]
MELILGKLSHNAKSITTEDAQSLADNAEEGDQRTANIIAAIADIAIRNEEQQGGSNDDDPRSAGNASQSPFNVSQDVMQRLRSNPGSITEEDARRFSENVEAKDARSARLVSAVESLAAARSDIYSQETSLGQSPHMSLLTVVKDLYAAVEANPDDVDTEILKTTQSIVSKMQKAIGHTNAPHPELEAELQQEYAKIVPKVERGVVTKAEADHLHSLEARAHGHTERGGLTAIAQSVAARHERRSSVSSGGNIVRSRANSRTFTPHKQPHYDTGLDLSKADPENWRAHSIAAANTALRSREQRSPEKGGVTPSSASRKRLQSLSESTNTTRGGDSIYDVAFPKLQSYGSADIGRGGSENVPRAHKRENSLPPV